MKLMYLPAIVLIVVPFIIATAILSSSEGGMLWKLRNWLKAKRERCDLCGSTDLSTEPTVGGHEVTCTCGRSWWSQ